jgi:hypothetical protein
MHIHIHIHIQIQIHITYNIYTHTYTYTYTHTYNIYTYIYIYIYMYIHVFRTRKVCTWTSQPNGCRGVGESNARGVDWCRGGMRGLAQETRTECSLLRIWTQIPKSGVLVLSHCRRPQDIQICLMGTSVYIFMYVCMYIRPPQDIQICLMGTYVYICMHVCM